MARPAGRKRNFPKSGYDIEAVRLIKAKALKDGVSVRDVLENAKIKSAEESSKGKSRGKNAANTPASKSFGISRDEIRGLLRDED